MSLSHRRCGTSRTENAARLWLGAVSALGLALLALTVARLAQWWTQPLPPLPLALLALWWMAAGMLLRYGGEAAEQCWPWLEARHLPLGTGLVVWGSFLISLPGTSATSLVLYWLWVLLAEAAGWGYWFLQHTGRQRSETPHASSASSLEPTEPLPGDGDSSPAPVAPVRQDEIPHSDPMDNPQVLQHWQHWDDGARQRWSGWVRVRRRPGETTASVHVAFCPPMEQVPQVHCEPVAGAEAEVELVRVYPHGAQLRLRWPDSGTGPEEEPAWTVVALEAVARLSADDSAQAA